MEKKVFLLIMIYLISFPEIFSKSFQITTPELEFDGYQLTISYDLVASDRSSLFYVDVEIRDLAGKLVKPVTLKGDVGDNISPGTNKKIFWVPEKDSIYLDEDVTVELLTEKHDKEFDRGSALLMSTVVPGLGQTKIKKGKPWWLASIPVYGALAGGYVLHQSYLSNYDAYIDEKTNDVRRNDLFDKAQMQMNLSGALFISAAALWIGNIVWVAAEPNKDKPMQLAKFSVNSVPYNYDLVALLSFRINF